MRTRDVRRTARRASLVLAGAVGLGLLTQAAASAQEGDGGGNGQSKVVICHATSSETNPYNRIEVAAPAAANGHSHGLEDEAGQEHGGHTGDIVPPFTYRQGGEEHDFPGQNWDEQGQAIWNDGCAVPEPAEPAPTLDVAVTAEDVCLGDDVTIVLDNSGSDVEVTFAGTLAAPDGDTTDLEATVAAGESGQLTVTPEETGAFTYAYTATADGADPVTGETGFTVADCEEVAFAVTVTTDADADGVCVGEDVTITLDNTASDVAATFTLVGATGEGDETTITRTVAAGSVETITRTPELGSYTLDWTATADGVDDVAGQVTYQVVDCTTEVEPGVTCPDGATEVDGECVVDEVDCPDGATEVDGECVVDEVVCPDGATEVDGECVVDEVVCPDGSTEVDGECVVDTTEGDEVVCPDGATEVDGECVVDEVVCPDGSTEVDGECVVDTTVGGEVDERDTVDQPDTVDGDVAVEGEADEQPRVERVVAEVGADTEVRGVTQAAGVAAAGQLPVTGAGTVPLLVAVGLFNLLFGVRLRRYGLRTRQQR